MKKEDTKKVIQIPWNHFPAELASGFSTKLLGNISFRTDDREVVRKRRSELAEAFGISWSDALLLPMSHTNRVLSLPSGSTVVRNDGGGWVSGGKIFDGSRKAIIEVGESEKPGCFDAIVTNMQGIYPTIFSADCVPVGFYDPAKRVIGLAHAGLVGLVNGIIPNTIECMVKEYRCRRSDIRICLFPAIRKCHYDGSKSGVWKHVKGQILRSCGEDHSAFEHDFINMHQVILEQIFSSGILPRHFHDTGICTGCSKDLLFSNASAPTEEAKAKEGRFASLLGMRP